MDSITIALSIIAFVLSCGFTTLYIIISSIDQHLMNIAAEQRKISRSLMYIEHVIVMKEKGNNIPQ